MTDRAEIMELAGSLACARMWLKKTTFLDGSWLRYFKTTSWKTSVISLISRTRFDPNNFTERHINQGATPCSGGG